MCICINCLHVHKCSTYKNIQKQHKKYYEQDEPAFDPLDPVIYVNLCNTSRSFEVDWDVIECLSFVDKPGNWVILK